MSLITALARLLIFPGLLFAVPAAWFFLWVERKAVALMQGRVGPPFMQPFYDFIKLLGKDTPPRNGVAGGLMRLWPLLAVSSAAGAVALLPVLPAYGGFQGDLILLLALLEMPSMCIIAAGFSSRSIFSEIGSAREAVLSVSYNIVFLLAILSIAASQRTFRLEALAHISASPLLWLGVIALLVCLPAKLHLNPFSLPNADNRHGHRARGGASRRSDVQRDVERARAQPGARSRSHAHVRQHAGCPLHGDGRAAGRYAAHPGIH